MVSVRSQDSFLSLQISNWVSSIYWNYLPFLHWIAVTPLLYKSGDSICMRRFLDCLLSSVTLFWWRHNEKLQGKATFFFWATLLCLYFGPLLCSRNVEFISRESLGHFRSFLNEEHRKQISKYSLSTHFAVCLSLGWVGPGETGFWGVLFILFCFDSICPSVVIKWPQGSIL